MNSTDPRITAAPPWRVLVVDDNPDDRAEVRRLLLNGSDRRYKFIEAADAASTVRTVREATDGPPDCVILDYYLPDAEAPELLADLLGPDGLTVAPVVVITIGAATAAARAALRAGAQDYVGKAWVTPESLTRAIENAAERWSMAREIRASKDALQAAENFHRQAFDQLATFAGVLDLDGTLIEVNRAPLEAGGWKRADVIGKPLWECPWCAYAPEVQARFREAINQAQGGQTVRFDIEVMMSGGLMPIDFQLAPLRDSTGRITHLIPSGNDITARKDAEKALLENKERLKEAQRIARLGSWSWEPQTNRVWWSEALFELFGVDPRVVSPSFDAFLALLHPDDRPVAVARVKATLDGAEEFADTLRIIRPDGQLIWIHSRARASRNANGEVVRVEGTDQDVTAERLAQEATRESEQRLQAAIEVADLGIILIDYDRQTVEISARAAEQFGFPLGIPVSRTDLHARFHPEDREEIEKLTAKALDPTGTGWFEMEHRVVLPDGTTRWVQVRKQVSFADGRPHRAIVVSVDVTDRRLAEALRASAERYRLLFDANPHPMWVFDIDSLRFQAVNDAAVQEYGYSREEFLTMTLRDIRPPEDMPRLEAAFIWLGPEMAHERLWQHRRKDGTVFDVDLTSQVLPDGSSRSRLALAINVTARNRAEKQLFAVNKRLQALMDALPVGVTFSEDETCERMSGNPVFLAQFGASLADNVSGSARDRDALGPQIQLFHNGQRLQAFERPLQRAVAENQTIPTMELEVVNPDGRRWFAEASGAPIRDAQGVVIGGVVVTIDVTERKRNEAAARTAEQRLQLALKAAKGMAFVWDIKRNAIIRNFSTLSAFPTTGSEEFKLADFRDHIHPDDLSSFDTRLSASLASGTDYRNAFRAIRPDGTIIYFEEYGYIDREADGSPVRLTGMSIDVTERVLLEQESQRLAREEQLRQSQKMEAVGLLAGGVAHDFNNLLTVINGYTEMLLDNPSVAAPMREPLLAIHDAGQRAARLTQQLLAFSRKSLIEPQLVELNDLVDESARLLRPLIGEDIELEVFPDPTAIWVLADPGQLAQVLMNLAVNARDAMPRGGRLTIETGVVELGSDRSFPGLSVGRYASLRVTDTGHGMSPEVRARIFEPFFTTKGIGQGTGLGLSVVHGVVNQAGGSIEVESSVGVGTTFTVLFPIADRQATSPDSGLKSVDPRGTETILMVEDEDTVRGFVRTALEGQGYTVLTASGGREALERLRTHPGPVQLLVTDVIMPVMSGRELADAARVLRPGLRVLYMSGYTDDVLNRHGLEQGADHLIQKPFPPLRLGRKVRAILDQSE